MESKCSEDASLLLNLLSESIEQINQLESAVDAPHREMAQQIRNTIKKAFSIAKMYSMGPQQLSFTSKRTLDSPRLNSDSLRSQHSEKVFKEHEHKASCKKRKTLDMCTSQVRVSQSGEDGAMDDGYCWRKYGQKDILGATHPRGYYRCTHRNTLRCFATKQVQRSDENPNVFDITYKGEHTCMKTPKAVTVSPSNEPDMRQNSFSYKDSMHQLQNNQFLLSFQKSLMAKTENPKAEDEGQNSSFSFPLTPAKNACFKLDEHAFSLSSTPEPNLISSFPTPFVSPATPESNFYPVSPSMSSYGGPPALHILETELNDIVSGTTSMTNSPMAGSSFMLDFAVSPSMSSYGGPPTLHTSESELNDIVSGTTSMTNSPMAGSSFMLDFADLDTSFPFGSNFFR